MNKIKILVVEDNIVFAKNIAKIILEFRLKVTNILTRVSKVYDSIKNDEPDLIIIDVCLNNTIDGIDIIKKIHQNKYIPVIYLTSLYDDQIIQKAIQTNPIGYIIKPFNKYELKATIALGIYKNTEKKTLNQDFKHLGFDYLYDELNQKLYYHDIMIKLSKKETKLLNLLILADNKIVLLETIEREVWNDYHVSKFSVRNVVYRLRNKVNYKFIQTIPYIGLKL